ncbi:nuclear transport factor 2 family protein [Brumimicrobium mesophilum]|uniref:nuclear transport factor 2 family protein n=1 Tax=Brumimicrobium mesophilum TaxID=392717 RepID=UPI000D1434CD|nr:nuclear transport factor 2 family protein [Brumimicrobium mesophilum]
MENSELIEKFYTSFSKGNYKGMIECYDDNVVFKDPAFGELKGERAKKMWEMLLSSKTSGIKISFNNVQVTSENGKANWTAKYVYGKSKRKVVNEVSAAFKFKDGKIIEHIDTFDLWKWTKQAMGIPGYLLGWSPFLKNKIQATTKKKLDQFIEKS